METLTLSSANSDAKLTFSELSGDYFRVTIDSSDHSATRAVYFIADAVLPLVDLFREAEKDWRGWKGKKTWGSVEGEFQVELEMDSLGHVTVHISLVGPYSAYPTEDSWNLTATIGLEAGQLSLISKDFNRFFGPEPNKRLVG